MTTPKRSNPGTTYAELERRAKLDLAVRTITDPHASAEHLAAARKALTAPVPKSPEETGALLRALDPRVLLAVRDALRLDANGRSARSLPALGTTSDATADTTATENK